MPIRARDLVKMAVLAAGAMAVGLTIALPRTTHADPIADSERQGEWEEEGMRFGDIVVQGKLVADGSVPGGWTLVRTLENKSDERASCIVEERVMGTETMLDARVGPSARAVLLRNQKIVLGPREKRTMGVRLPESLGAKITAGHRARAMAEQARARVIDSGKPDSVASRTFTAFDVEYLTPLPAGATAAAPADNGFSRPAGYAMP
jgi:hypothetical protein